MTHEHYILDDEGNLKVVDLMTWARWFETAERQTASDFLGDVRVSTVFLGIDHNFSDDGPPLFWETMIFGGPNDQYQDRYSSRADALLGHAKALELAKVTA